MIHRQTVLFMPVPLPILVRSSHLSPNVSPDFLFVGPAKTGTTWVHDYLAARGDVMLPHPLKETFFFDKYPKRGMSWYRAQFRLNDVDGKSIDRQGIAPCFEVAPSYSDDAATATRIAEALPDVQVVMTVRDPVARCLSQFWHWRRYGNVPAPLTDLVACADEALLGPSSYAALLHRWHSALGEDRVKVLVFEDLARDPDEFVRHLCSVLSLPYQPAPAGLISRQSNARAVPRSAAVARLAAQLRRVVYDLGLSKPAKRLGATRLRHMLERAPTDNDRSEDTPTLRANLYAALAVDICAFEAKLGREFPDWHRHGQQ